MINVNDSDEPDLGNEVKVAWENLKKELSKGEYRFLLHHTDVYKYDGYPAQFEDQPNDEDNIVIGTATHVNMEFNAFNSQSGYERHLNEFVNEFKMKSSDYIDNRKYSVSERLAMFHEISEDVKRAEKYIFNSGSTVENASRKSQHLLNIKDAENAPGFSDPDAIWNDASMDVRHPDIQKILDDSDRSDVQLELSHFVKAQFAALKEIEAFVEMVRIFVPGRIDGQLSDSPLRKVNLMMTKVEAVALLLAMRAAGIIGKIDDATLAKFIEDNFLFRQQSFRDVKSLISKIKTNAIESGTALNEVKTRLQTAIEIKTLVTH